MALSIFTTITRPEQRGDNYREALDCYGDLADEVIVIDGEKTWPQEFNWPLIGEHFQKGYEKAKGDWVIHMDLDFFFHQRDFGTIRQAIKQYDNEPALSFWKYQFVQPDRYNLKSRLILAVNKGKYGDRIRFDSGGDLCQPSLDGKYIKPGEVPEARIPFYNYEKLSKTKEQITDDVERMERAYRRHFNKPLYGDDAFGGWYDMAKGRFNKPQEKTDDHPKYIKKVIDNLKPGQFGYDGFGLRSRDA